MQSEVKFQNSIIENVAFRVFLSLIFILSTVSIQVHFDQNDFFSVFPVYTISFLALIGLYLNVCPIAWVLALGLIVRVVSVYSFPGFSDDIYRFYWDGQLILSGVSPYGKLPVDVLSLQLPFLNQTLFDQLNSQNYYTVYPPVNQLYFAVATLAGDIQNAVIATKILVLITELAGVMFLLKLMKHAEIDSKYIILFFLNPLVITEGIGNLHFEIVMLSLLCISLYYIFSKRLILGAFVLSLSIGVKLLPLMLLPYFLFRMKGQNRMLFFGYMILFLILVFFPLWYSVDFASFFSSVDLYFRKFEFNAGVYYVARYFGKLLSGYNQISYIGPLLAILTLVINVKAATAGRGYSIKSFFTYGLFVWSVYLFLATTIHPWYILSLVFFSMISGFKYPFVWSFLVFISYVNYSYDLYYENLWFIGLEYFLLSIFIVWEYTNWCKGPKQVV